MTRNRQVPVVSLFAVIAFLWTLPAAATESVTYEGQMGLSQSFSLVGGQYTIYVNAHYATEWTRRNNCVFGANLQRVAPTHESVEIGSAVPITGAIHFNLGPKPISLGAGLYELHVAAATNCHWRFTLVSTNQNAAGVQPIAMSELNPDDHGSIPSETVHLGRKAQFVVQYRTDHDAEVPVSGKMQLVHDGKVMDSAPLRLGKDPDNQANIIFVVYEWEQKDTAYLGKNTMRFTMTIGGKQFTESMDFTVTR